MENNLSLWIGLAIVVVLALVVLGIYNKIIAGTNRAQRAWADVLVYERQKTKVLDALQPMLSDFKEYESGLMTTITGLRGAISGLPTSANGDALRSVESGTRELMSGLRVAVEAYPNLKASELFNNVMREISEQQANVGAAITIFNREVELFNNSIQMFPNSMVNSTLNKKQAIKPFEDAEASKGFAYTPTF